MNALEQQIATFLAKKGISNPQGLHSFEKGNYALHVEFFDGGGSTCAASTQVRKSPIRRFKEEYIRDSQLLSDLTQLSGPIDGFAKGWKDRDRNRYEKNWLLLHSPFDHYVTLDDVLDETKICAETCYNSEGKFKVVQVWGFKEDGKVVRRDLYFPDLTQAEQNSKYCVNSGWCSSEESAQERFLDIDFSYDEKEVKAILSKNKKEWYQWTFPRQNLSISEKLEQLLAEFS